MVYISRRWLTFSFKFHQVHERPQLIRLNSNIYRVNYTVLDTLDTLGTEGVGKLSMIFCSDRCSPPQ